MTWDESDWDDHFSDLAHASREGELYFTSRLHPIVDEIIKSRISEYFIQTIKPVIHLDKL